jgi:linoleoyl-CoA desaturase
MGSAAKVKFPPRDAFHVELVERAAVYFAQAGRSRRGGPAMFVKTAIMFAWLALSWTLLMFAPLSPGLVALAVISLALAMAGIGFTVMHDANHGAYAESPRVNALFSTSLDLLGASSFLWRQAHNVLHHSYTNISTLDIDLEMSTLLRVAPWQTRRPYHRFQHLYVSLLFGIFPLKWWLFDDPRMFIFGRGGPQKFPRARGRVLVKALLLKAVFIGWAFVVPVLLHPTWWLIPLWLLASFVLGNLLGWIFQLAHCVADADFIEAARGERLATSWAVHQVRTTVDFARESRLVSWYLGGLNFQVEHHLFPDVCHTHYPALANVVEETCRAHGIRYRTNGSFLDALAENIRWLRALGTGGDVLRG